MFLVGFYQLISSNQVEREIWNFVVIFMCFVFVLTGDSIGIDAEGVLQARENRSVSADFGRRI